MAVQEVDVGPSGVVTSTGVVQSIIDYQLGIPGGSANGNTSDSDNNTGVNMSSGSAILFDLGNSPLSDVDLIDYVVVHGTWSADTGFIRFLLLLDVNGVHYADATGDEWIGSNHGTLGTRDGVVHATQPDGTQWNLTDLGATRVEAIQWYDSTTGIAVREIWLAVQYYRQPVLSALHVSGLPTAPNGRVLTWTYAGDGPATAGEIYVYDHSATPGDPGSLTHVSSGAGQSYTLPAVSGDGTYYVYVRQALTGQRSGFKRYSAWKAVSYVVDRGPVEPLLLEPANGTNRDVSAAGWQCAWEFKHPTAGEVQSAWALRRLMSGGVYEFFNITSRTWSTTIVYNAGAAAAVVWQANEWALGHSYSWSVSTKDSGGTAGPFATDFTIIGNTPPTCTIVSPSGSVTNTSSPDIFITFADVDGDAMEMYDAKVYASDEYTDPDFDPDDPAFTAVWASGPVVGATTTIPMTTHLPNNDSYKVFVKVRAAGAWSLTWAARQFSINITPPATPTLSVSGNSVSSLNAITILSSDLYSFDIEFSDDESVTWQYVRNAKGRQTTAGEAVVNDFECPARFSRRYRAFAFDPVTLVYSLPSTVVVAAPLLTTEWFLKVPEDPSKNRAVKMIPNFSLKKPVQSGTFYPSGSALAVVIKATEPTTGWEFDAPFRVLTKVTNDHLVDVLAGSDILLLQDVLAEQWYCSAAEEISRNRIHGQGTGTDPVGFFYEVTAHMIEVERPEV